MTSDEIAIIKKVRDYLYQADVKKINALETAKATGIPVQDLLEIAPTPKELVYKIFQYEMTEFSSIFDDYDFDDKNAIYSLIIIGQEVYKRFHDLNPAVSYHLKEHYPDLYFQHLDNKINFLTKKVISNLKQGQAQGIYKQGLDTDEIINKFTEKVSRLHNHDLLSSGKLSFDIVFNDLIEDFIKDISHEEGWSYYKNRKHLVEALDFNR